MLTTEGPLALDVLVRGGLVAEIAPHGALSERLPDAPSGTGTELDDLGDALLMPAVIDAHCHINEPGRTHWEGFSTATRAAAAGGIALLVDMPLNSTPVTIDAAALERKVSAARGQLHVDVAFYAGVVPANATDEQRLAELSRAGAVAFKCFLCDSGLADFPAVSGADLAAAMPHLARLGKHLLAHAELFAPPIGQEVQRASSAMPPDATVPSSDAWASARPPEAELRAIELLAELCERTGCAVHIVHLATARALPRLAAWRSAGLPITVETCPHYLTFTAEDIPPSDPCFKCAPPLRHAANREGLWRGLADGTIDFVASDHSPCPPELKQTDFADAWGGISSLQLLLPATWTAAQQRGHGLTQLANWLSRGPAHCLDLPRSSVLAVGARADLVAWHPERSFVVRGAELEHRHPLTAYEGRELLGVVQRTYRAGSLVFDHAERGNARFPIPLEGEPLRLRAAPGAHYPGFEAWQAQTRDVISQQLAQCCGAQQWQRDVLAALPWRSPSAFFRHTERAFDQLTRADWLEAFAAHPRIGDLESLARRFASTKSLASSEQAATAHAEPAVLEELRAANLLYEERFGHVFLICASGKKANEMLAALRARLPNAADVELEIAAEEQRKITFLRLEKLLRPSEGATPIPE